MKFTIAAVAASVGLCCVVDAEEPIAVVLSREICRADLCPSERETVWRKADLSPNEYEEWQAAYPAEKLAALIKGPLLEKYKQEKGLAATEAELAPYLKKWRHSGGKAAEASPGGAESKKAERVVAKKFFASIVESRKIGKSLFEKYGGRVSISSFGFVVPIDAETRFLREKMKEGAFSILDGQMEKAFWAHVSKPWGDGTLTEERAKEMFSSPDYLLQLTE